MSAPRASMQNNNNNNQSSTETPDDFGIKTTHADFARLGQIELQRIQQLAHNLKAASEEKEGDVLSLIENSPAEEVAIANQINAKGEGSALFIQNLLILAGYINTAIFQGDRAKLQTFKNDCNPESLTSAYSLLALIQATARASQAELLQCRGLFRAPGGPIIPNQPYERPKLR
ncbi:MAG: hypothetical protein P4M14_13675 [Gammaproteobacteria bacterium]|nr:hypothetical protein [Gammaproteobacteria bacterium]